MRSVWFQERDRLNSKVREGRPGTVSHLKVPTHETHPVEDCLRADCRLTQTPWNTDGPGAGPPLTPIITGTHYHRAQAATVHTLTLYRLSSYTEYRVHRSIIQRWHRTQTASCRGSIVDHHHTATICSAHSITYHSGEFRHEHKQAKDHPEYSYFVLNVGSFCNDHDTMNALFIYLSFAFNGDRVSCCVDQAVFLRFKEVHPPLPPNCRD